MRTLNDIDWRENTEGVLVSKNDNQIFDYLADKHGKEMMRELEVREENTGVAMFFDDSTYKDLVVVLRLKFFEEELDNGFIMFLIKDLHLNPDKLKSLKLMLAASFADTKLEKFVLETADKFAMKSIESNA